MSAKTMTLVVVIALTLGGLGVYYGKRAYDTRCGATATEVDVSRRSDPGLKAPSMVRAPGAREAVRAARRLPPRSGHLTGVLWKSDSFDAPAPIAGEHGYSLASGSSLPGMELSGTIAGYVGGSRRPAWVRGYRGASAGGGYVGDRFVTLGVIGDRVEVAAYDGRTGDQESCTRLGQPRDEYDPLLTTAPLDDGSVLVGYRGSGDPNDSRVDLTRLDPGDGDVRWSRRTRLTRVADVFTGSRLAVTAPYEMDDYVRGDVAVNLALPDSAPVDQPSRVSAFDIDSGKPAWTYDPGNDRVAAVAGVSSGDITYALVARGTSSGTDPQGYSQVVALDARGNPRWRHRFALDAEAIYAGDQTVLVRDRVDRRLTALDASNGATRWTREMTGPRSFSYRELSDGDRQGRTWLQPTDDNLWMVDLKTGSEHVVALDDLHGVSVGGRATLLELDRGVMVLSHSGRGG